MKLFYLVFLFTILISTVYSVPCQCTCCKNDQCQSRAMKPFDVSSCDACTYDACASRYPTECPSSTEKGTLMVTCGDPAQIAILIGVVAGSSCLLCLFCCCIIGALITVIVCVVRAASNQKPKDSSGYQTLLQ